MALDFSNFYLQFITNGNGEESLAQAKAVLEGGCRWVQLRMKDATEEEMEPVAKKMSLLCSSYGATFIIDDHVEMCKRIGASGVHLGKNDMHPKEAREILGTEKIIGGTCNTIDDVMRVSEYVDYIGCGPFRYTTTKKNLAPVLGLEGYREIIWEMRSRGINIPVVAIGGITINDIRDVLEAGPNGIALSGEIIRSDDMTKKTEEIVRAIVGE